MDLKLEKAREEAPVVLNLIKDTGWCYTFGIVSVVAFVPVFTFQCYEAWRARKEGARKVMVNIAGAVAVLGNGAWMVGDIFFHDHFRPYVKWIFNVGFIFLAVYGIIAYFQNRKVQCAEKPERTMMVSKETKSIIFVHSRLGRLPHPQMRNYHHVVVRRRNRPNH
jgi:hypothetical protein